MSPSDRSQIYADAFFQAAWEDWLGALQGIEDQLERRPELHERLEGSHLDLGQRQRLLDSLLPAEVDRPVRNLLYAMLERNELTMLPGVVAALRERLRSAGEGPVDVEVVSAVPLADDQRRALAAQLEAQHGQALDIHYRVDPGILGGLIVRVGDSLIDSSVASRLAAIRQALGVTAA